MSDINFEAEVIEEMFEVVAEALLYKEDAAVKLKQSKLCPKTWTIADCNKVYRYILKSPRFKEIQTSYEELESATLIDDNLNTIMLMYNKLLRDAQIEQKYDVVVRILKEIRQLKAIENEQMKFEIVFKIMENNKNEQK